MPEVLACRPYDPHVRNHASFAAAVSAGLLVIGFGIIAIVQAATSSKAGSGNDWMVTGVCVASLGVVVLGRCRRDVRVECTCGQRRPSGGSEPTGAGTNCVPKTDNRANWHRELPDAQAGRQTGRRQERWPGTSPYHLGHLPGSLLAGLFSSAAQ